MLATAALTFSQALLARILRPGDIAVDATAGNGHDAVFLARHVAPNGLVHCLDIQPAALDSTRARLAAAGLADMARLHDAGHERLGDIVPAADRGRVRAVVFNLGYLPGGDATVTTRPVTTLAALEAARRVLCPGGALAVVCYTGHPGGADEARAVAAWCAGLPFAAWRAARYELVNKPGDAIVSFFVENIPARPAA
ncbi:MAG: tRNA (mnm(5)s(2)U34)-methyltransferase [Solidesulfovibrio sp. DCME]|uniref:tRNA (mnm(5)s(2)U34)-methyltransferase n=1 Tax=Solidesulfovibrio sp. DCME TaxID=3447380 RepID=UPI003D10DCC0